MNPGIGPIAFYIGPWPVHWYGILFAVAIIIGTLLAASEAKRRGEDPDKLWDGVLVVVVSGLIGGRLYHVVDQWNALYANNPVAVLYIWNGGLGIYGALLGGAIGLAFYTHYAKLNYLRWLDIAAPSLILGQAIGRWGNFMNRELYGTPTNLPWALYIEPQYRVPGFEGFSHFHPLFLYESLWNLGIFAFLIWLTRRSKIRLLDGDVINLYLILYSVGRLVLESIKIGEVWTIGGFRTAQIIAAVIIVAGSAVMVYRHRKADAVQPVPPPA